MWSWFNFVSSSSWNKSVHIEQNRARKQSITAFQKLAFTGGRLSNYRQVVDNSPNVLYMYVITLYNFYLEFKILHTRMCIPFNEVEPWKRISQKKCKKLLNFMYKMNSWRIVQNFHEGWLSLSSVHQHSKSCNFPFPQGLFLAGVCSNFHWLLQLSLNFTMKVHGPELTWVFLVSFNESPCPYKLSPLA